MIVAFTGHRPNKLGGYKTPNRVQTRVCWFMEDELRALQPSLIISGMALGVDQWAVLIAIRMGIPFRAAVPFKGQEQMWPAESRNEYSNMLQRAQEVVIVCPGGYSPEKMQRRNEYMVDACDVLIAVWDGTPGGTQNCVKYAERRGKRISRIEP